MRNRWAGAVYLSCLLPVEQDDGDPENPRHRHPTFGLVNDAPGLSGLYAVGRPISDDLTQPAFIRGAKAIAMS